MPPSFNRTVVVAAAALGMTVSAPTVGFAQRKGDPAAAEALFQRGVALQKQNDWKGACDAFAASMELDQSVGTQINLARCADHEGKTADAWAAFRRAKALNAETPLVQRKADIDRYVDGEIRRLEGLLPWMRVVVRAAPPLAVEGLTVVRDGVPVPLEGLAVEVPVNPGRHLVVVSAPGYAEARVEVELAPGEHKVATLDLVRSRRGLGPRGGRGQADGGPLLVAGIALGSVGVAGLVVAAVTGGIAAADKSTIDDLGSGPCRTRGGILDCPESEQQAARDAIDRGEAMSLASTVALFAGAGLAATGVILIAVGASEGGSIGIGVEPKLSPGYAGITMTGQF